MTVQLRSATQNDAHDMARLANIAGEGLPEAIWRGLAHSDETALDVGARRAADTKGVFSWKNAVIAEIDGETAGMVISYLTGSDKTPLTENMHPIIRPLTTLENKALETRYIHLMATFKEFRGRGVARCMMDDAATRPGKNGLSVITTDQNAYGRGFYEALGFRETAQAPVIKTNWDTSSQFWHLMVKP